MLYNTIMRYFLLVSSLTCLVGCSHPPVKHIQQIRQQHLMKVIVPPTVEELNGYTTVDNSRKQEIIAYFRRLEEERNARNAALQ